MLMEFLGSTKAILVVRVLDCEALPRHMNKQIDQIVPYDVSNFPRRMQTILGSL